MESINLKSIGELIQNSKWNDWWDSQETAVPYFDNLKLKFTIMDVDKNEIDDHFNLAIESFLKLTSQDRLNVSPYIFDEYNEFVDLVGEDSFDFTIENEVDVWEHIQPQFISISRREKDGLVYVVIHANCDWEEEHGLQIVYRNGNQLSRVSPKDGHLTYADAHDLDDAEDKIR